MTKQRQIGLLPLGKPSCFYNNNNINNDKKPVHGWRLINITARTQLVEHRTEKCTLTEMHNKKLETNKQKKPLNNSSTDSMCPKLSHLWLHDPVKQTKTGVASTRAHPAVSNLQPHSAFINSAAGSKLTSPVETEMNHQVSDP